jgi:hypothetical protein
MPIHISLIGRLLARGDRRRHLRGDRRRRGRSDRRRSGNFLATGVRYILHSKSAKRGDATSGRALALEASPVSLLGRVTCFATLLLTARR